MEIKDVLKWIGLLPVAIISSMLAFALGSLIGYVSTRMFVFGGDGRWIWAISRLIASILAGYVFVCVGAMVAPKFKLQTSVFLTGLVLVLVTIGITLQLVLHTVSGFWEQVEIYLGGVLAFAGAFSGHVSVKNEKSQPVNEMPIQKTKEPNTTWNHTFGIGDKISLKMEEGGTCIGEITALDNLHRKYVVTFEDDISLMPAEEPEGGWIDNSYPQKTLKLSENEFMLIANRKLIGTTIHYHF